MIPSTAWQQLRGASWTNLREANFQQCLVLQTWLQCLTSSLDAVFCRMLRALSQLFLWQFLATLKGQKCERVSWKWSDMQKSLARGTATDCRQFILTVPFWALQVLWRGHQRCRWGRRPAGSLAELSPGEVELWSLLSNSVHCMAEAAWRQLDQFKRSKLLRVPRLANLVAMFGQYVEMPYFFRMSKGHCHGCFFDNIWQHWKAKNVKESVGNGQTCKSHSQEERRQIAVLWSPQSSFEHSRCFDDDTSADGAADLLEVLRNSPLEKLNFDDCSQIPSTAWQKLRGASWTNLREADFGWCLVLQTWLQCLTSSLDPCFLRMFDSIWQHWKAKNVKESVGNGQTCKSHSQEERRQIAVLWSPQSPFEHSRCFAKNTKGADRAADLLEVLRNSPLEKLNFRHCQIPSTVWQKLQGASWTNLREANFFGCLVLQTWLQCLASSF